MILTEAEVSAVLTQHEPMVWWVARKATGPHASESLVEDVASVVRLSFVVSARRYDPALGYRFATFALPPACRAAFRHVHVESRRGIHLPRYQEGAPTIRVPQVLRFDHARGGKQKYQLDPAAPLPVDTPDFPSDFWVRIRAVLTALQWQAIELRFLWGLSTQEIARRLTTECGRNLFQNAFKAIRRQLPELAEYLKRGCL